MLAKITEQILLEVRAKIASGSTDLPGEVIFATRKLGVHFGYHWSARTALARVIFSESGEESAVDKRTLAVWCVKRPTDEIIQVIDAALSS